jgi:MFS family permease
VTAHSPDTRPRSTVALLLVINLFCYIDRYILSAVAPSIRSTFFAPDDPNALEKTGWLFTAFLVSYMVASPLFGWLADRMSRWVLIAIGVAVWSLASSGSGFAQTFGFLIVMRTLVGIGEAAYGPAAPTIIADLFPIQRRGRVLAWFFAAIPVGSAIGYMFGGVVGNAFGWRWPFHLVAPPGMLLAALCLFMREPRHTRQSSPCPAPPKWNDYLQLLRTPSYTINVLAQTAMTFAIGGISAWAPTYIFSYREQPDLGRISLIFGGITAVAGLVATLLGGWAGDKLRYRFAGSYFLVSSVGMLLAFPCTVAMLYVPFPVAWIFIFLAVFFLFFNIGPANTAIANVTNPSVRATAYAVNILVIHALGDAISPPLIGAIADRSNMNNGFLVVSLAMLVAGILWLVGMRFLPRDTARIAAATP